jgi:hypothetical protein
MARCKYCRVLYEKNGTGNMKSHMLKKHSDQMSAGHDLVQSTITSDVTKAVFKASFLLFSCGCLMYRIFIAILQFNQNRSMDKFFKFVVSNNRHYRRA